MGRDVPSQKPVYPSKCLPINSLDLAAGSGGLSTDTPGYGAAPDLERIGADSPPAFHCSLTPEPLLYGS
jgi:hypothetical protein